MSNTLYKLNKNPKKSIKNTGFRNKEKVLKILDSEIKKKH